MTQGQEVFVWSGYLRCRSHVASTKRRARFMKKNNILCLALKKFWKLLLLQIFHTAAVMPGHIGVFYFIFYLRFKILVLFWMEMREIEKLSINNILIGTHYNFIHGVTGNWWPTCIITKHYVLLQVCLFDYRSFLLISSPTTLQFHRR